MMPWRKKPQRSLVAEGLCLVHMDQLWWILKPSKGSGVKSWHLEAEANQALIEIKSMLLSGLVINHGIHYQTSDACFFLKNTASLHPRAVVLEMGITG